ncbi:MAG: DNA-3-methyladenine glycosylase, partial [Silvibacterium sp.]
MPILPRSFYLDSPEIVARKLLGKLITRRINGKKVAGRIVELEAYLGLDDPAAHAFAGKTARNA